MLFRDRRDVRVLLPRVALRAAGAGLLAAGGEASRSFRSRFWLIIVGAGVSQPIARRIPVPPRSRSWGIARSRSSASWILAGRRRGRDVPRQPAAGHHPDVDRHGHDVPAADARGDHRRSPRRTPASRRACSTPRSRWAARSAWRSCRRSPPRTRRACSRAWSGGADPSQQRAEAVVEGFQVAYLGGMGPPRPRRRRPRRGAAHAHGGGRGRCDQAQPAVAVGCLTHPPPPQLRAAPCARTRSATGGSCWTPPPRVFAERGLEAGVAEIAQRAGVGTATVFRRFPTKQDLIVAVVDARICDMGDQLDAAQADPDPWAGVVTAPRGHRPHAGARPRAVRGDRQHLLDRPALLRRHRVVLDVVDPLVVRAQQAGVLRGDVTTLDVLGLVKGAAAAVRRRPRPARPTAGGASLAIVLDGAAARGGHPAAGPAALLRRDRACPRHRRRRRRAERRRGPAHRRDRRPRPAQPRDHDVLLAALRRDRGARRRRRELVHVRDVGVAAGGAHDPRRGLARAARPQARRAAAELLHPLASLGRAAAAARAVRAARRGSAA